MLPNSVYEPDLILLDINLRGKPGTEVCKEIKESYAHIPVIYFSAFSEKEHNFTTCADGFIHKPFDLGSFINQIKSLTAQITNN